MNPNVTLLVIAKTPAPGRVKTRLCPPCTPTQAAALAAAALRDTLDVVAATPAIGRVLVLDGPPGPWVPAGVEVRAQTGSGLDQRLAHAFSHASGPALLVGMDTPQLTVELLEHASRVLLAPGVDSVLGPAFDGGWWGIGLRRPDPRAFLGVETSTPRTFCLQRARLTQLELRVRVLGALRDVDHFADAIHVAGCAPETRFARTLAGLKPDVGGTGEKVA